MLAIAMANLNRIELEREALESLVGLYQQAQKCKELYERAHMALPEALQRFLGLNGVPGKTGSQRHASVQIPPPVRPNAPDEAEDDWIWINIKDALATTVTLAILKAAGEPVRHKDITARVTELLTVPSGTISNIGTRLDGKLIQRTEDGWILLKPEVAATIRDGLLWGPPTIFDKQELAAHRRDGIIHILKHYSAGLQTVQMVEQLHNCSWIQAPINKDLVKADMEALLAAGKVRRRGNTKKWEITSNE